MNRIPFLLAVVLLLAACEQPAETSTDTADNGIPVEWASFGDGVTITEDEAFSVADLVENPGSYDDQLVRVDGNVVAVCQMAGCWLQLENPDGEPLRIHVPRDPETRRYVWTFPMNLGPSPAIVQGIASTDTISVAQQQHYLEDGGASQEEIDAITEPQLVTRLVADGALIENVPVEEPVEDEMASDDSDDVDA